MAWRNIWRNKRRTFITMASVFFAVILAIIMRATITGTFQKMISDVVGLSSGYIQVHKRGYWKERSVDNTFKESDKLNSVLNEEKEIIAWSPRLECFTLASSGNRTRGVMLMGVYPEKENAITHIKEKITEGNFISNDDKGILIPEGLSTYLQLKVNDTIILLGQGYHGIMAAAKYPVKGVIKLGSPELNKSMCWLPMACVKDFLGTENRLSSISLLLKKEKKTEEVKQRLISKNKNEDYEIMTWKEMLPDLDQFIEADSSAHIITVNILYLIIAFGIFGTILMMMNERMHEFGILVAVGMKKRILSSIIFIEIVLISGLGVLLGMSGALPLVLYFHYNPIKFTGELAKGYEEYGMEPIIPTSMDIANFTSQAYIVFVIATVLSVYPFYKINKIKVIKAINS
ncbi:MAG: ABC transporter permease [Bacteroidia bacterium]